MREITLTSQFKRDYKKRSRDKSLAGLLEQTVELLAAGKPLEPRLRDHALKGGYAGCRECHLRPDLLLIYFQTSDELRLIRRGATASCSPDNAYTESVASLADDGCRPFAPVFLICEITSLLLTAEKRGLLR